ncbi:MAG: translocator protein [Acetobacterium sp.]|nr:translocator protein [Acetobacterium sp.]
MNKRMKAGIGLILLIGTLIINSLGAFGFFNGLTQKDVSDQYATLITPAPFTFSIWSVIYILLIAAAVVTIIKSKEPYYEKTIDGISYLFWFSSILNMLWIICFSFTFIGLSVIVILAFSITLSLILKEITKIQTGNHWLIPAAFGMYTGWLLIASVVNTAAWLVKIQWQGFGILPEYWGIIMIMVAVALTVVVTLTTTNALVPIPVAWGYFGIYQSLMAMNGGQGTHQFLAISTLVGMVCLVVMAGIQFYSNRYRVMPEVHLNLR